MANSIKITKLSFFFCPLILRQKKCENLPKRKKTLPLSFKSLFIINSFYSKYVIIYHGLHVHSFIYSLFHPVTTLCSIILHLFRYIHPCKVIQISSIHQKNRPWASSPGTEGNRATEGKSNRPTEGNEGATEIESEGTSERERASDRRNERARERARRNERVPAPKITAKRKPQVCL